GLNVDQWTQEPYLDLFIANRDEEGLLSNPKPLGGDVNTQYHESTAVFTKDGKTIYFTRNSYIDGQKELDKSKKHKTLRLSLFKAE
ncbi:flagellar motor protein MotB, partial [Aequorivita sp. KMM 9714]|nr:flagellar motor protein MotB [Aequorivita sp. KMM 9714]